MLRLTVNGAAGRMGRRVTAVAAAANDVHVIAALENQDHPQIGRDAGELAGIETLNVPVLSQLDDDAEIDVIIDFSKPEGAEHATALARSRGIPLVIATTGLSDTQQAAIRAAAEIIPIVWAPSMSLTVNLAMKLCALASSTLAAQTGQVDVEIIERHHRFKEDAPSGTAFRFGEIVAKEMGQTLHRHGREGMTGQRSSDEIGYHALRTGDNPGEHTIIFAPLGETLEITVRASNRDCYAIGALAAARFVVKQSPGLYGMDDVLGLKHI
ncbi:MAG: 4-hydroxy-tetrahydrodipicolinate reductase [Pirellulales bacterium]|nr:4-hydroxy-tetrahydrodipicolinate reductase [Pirellulales bacterium]